MSRSQDDAKISVLINFLKSASTVLITSRIGKILFVQLKKRENWKLDLSEWYMNLTECLPILPRECVLVHQKMLHFGADS